MLPSEEEGCCFPRSYAYGHLLLPV